MGVLGGSWWDIGEHLVTGMAVQPKISYPDAACAKQRLYLAQQNLYAILNLQVEHVAAT